MSDEVPVLTVADASAWSQWLTENEHQSEGVWLVLVKKGTVEPTHLTYDEALEDERAEVGGQLAKGDERTFRRRFTPRRPGSGWSKRNVALADRLVKEGCLAEWPRWSVPWWMAAGTGPTRANER